MMETPPSVLYSELADIYPELMDTYPELADIYPELMDIYPKLANREIISWQIVSQRRKIQK